MAALAHAMEVAAATTFQEAAGPNPSGPVASFTLPAPPSTNALYKNVSGKGRVKTRTYKDWRSYALTEVRRQNVRNVDAPCVVLVAVERQSTKADIDNTLKASLDLMVAAGVLSDDSFVTFIAAVWAPRANATAHIQIYPCQPMTLTFHPSPDGASGAVLFDAPSNDGDDDDGHFAI